MNQKGFSKTVFIIIGAIILIGIGGYFMANQQANQQVNESPSYTELSSCSETAQFVIRTKAFPENLIHSCKTSQYTVDSDKFNVVEIEYGSAQDCPSGCFYDFFISAVSIDQQTFFELPGTPGDSKNYILTTVYDSLPQYDFSKIDFNCNKELDSLTTIKLAKHNGQIGWQFTLMKPYICSLGINTRTQSTVPAEGSI